MLKRFWQNFEQSVSCTKREHRHSNKGNFATFYLSKSKFINNILPQFGIAAYLLNALFLNCSCVLGRANYPQEFSGVATHTIYTVDGRLLIPRPDSLRNWKKTSHLV